MSASAGAFVPGQPEIVAGSAGASFDLTRRVAAIVATRSPDGARWGSGGGRAPRHKFRSAGPFFACAAGALVHGLQAERAT